jgi:hypothetical protein
MGLFDWLFGKKAAAPSRSGTYAIKAPRSNPRHKKMRHNPWKPCDDPAVKLRRPAEYMGAEFSLERGRRKGKFEIVGCGVAPTKIRKYGGVRTGLYAAKYEDGRIRYLPKSWVASTYSRVQRAEAAKAEGVAPKRRKKGKKAAAKPRKSAKAAPRPRKGAKSSKGSLVGRGCKKVTFKPAGKKQVSFLSCPPGVRKLQLGASQFQGMLGLPAPRKPKKATSRKPKKAAPKKAASRKPKKGTTSGMVRMVEQFRALAAAARGRKAAAAAKPKKAASRKPKKAAPKKAAPKKAAPKKSRARRSSPKPMSMSMPGILRRPIGFSARRASQPGNGVIFAPGGVEVIPASVVSGMGRGRFSSSPMAARSLGGAPSPFLLGPGSGSVRAMGGAPSPFLLGPGSPAKKASKKRPKKGAGQMPLALANPSRRRMNYLY